MFGPVFTPVVGLVLVGYFGQCEYECVDGLSSVCAWPGGGFAPDVALDVDRAALDAAGGPALFGSSPTEWCFCLSLKQAV